MGMEEVEEDAETLAGACGGGEGCRNEGEEERREEAAAPGDGASLGSLLTAGTSFPA